MKTTLHRFLSASICLLLALSTFSQTTTTATFNYTGSIVTYTVPAGVTKLTITAKGASGGGGIKAGLGASIQGDFSVTPGQVLRILVGQEGFAYGSSNYSGGGGSFVANNATNSPLIVAGGGGGASCSSNGLPGNTSQNGTSGNGGAKTSFDGGGGINGGGGGGAALLEESSVAGGGGGAGFYGNGGRGISISPGFLCIASTSNMFGGVGGNGAAGGDATSTSSCTKYYTSTANSFLSGGQAGIYGSFGGGGAARNSSMSCSDAANGGGGGYSGGGGGLGSSPGGGGGSFNVGLNQVNASGVNYGKGQVVIVAELPTPATALKTDGVDDHVTISNPFRSFGKAITVEFWMNSPTGKLAQGSVMGQSSLNVDGMATDVWLMHPDIGGTNIDFYVNDAGTWRSVTVPIRVGGWHHYVGVASEFGTKFYVDGVLERTGPGISTGILNNANSIIQIGKDPRHTNLRFADMSIDEVRIWSRALCLEEIANNKNCELNPTGQNGLQEYYRFNQGFVGTNNSTETTLTDLSGNNRHGTLSGFALTGNNSNWIQSGFVSTANCSPYVAPIAPIAGNISLCIGSNTTLANATTGGLWSSSNMAVATINTNTGVVNALSAGTTTITYRTECGGVSTATLTVNAFPVANISGTNTICSGGSTVLTASGGGTYVWNTGATTAAINISPTATTTYSVTATSAVGCVSTAANRTVTVIPRPTVTASSNSPVNPGVNLQLSASGAVTYTWSGPNGFSSSLQNPIINSPTSTASGTYTVTGTNANGCANTASVDVTVLSVPATALKTDGVDDHVTINNPFRSFGKAITVEFWMNSPTGILAQGSVMGQSSLNVDGMATDVWLMHPDIGSTNIDFYVNDAGTWRKVTVPIRVGGWHHYVGVASEFGTKFYVDGVLEVTGPGISAGILNNANSIIQIGKDPRHTNLRFADMSIDEVRIWSRALCEDEIINNKNCELNPTGQNDLQEYYRFNQGFVGTNNLTETTLTDLSGNNRHGTLSGFALTGNNSNWIQSGFVSTANCSPYVAPIAPIAGNISLCIGSNTTLTNANAGGRWTSSNTGVATINTTTGQVTTVSVGTTTVTYTTECGGVSTATLTVNALPVASIAGTNTICSGGSTVLTASGGATYLWNTGATTAAISVSPTVTTTYSVTATSAAGCTSQASRTVTVNASPTAAVIGMNIICSGSSTTLTASGGGTYSWNTGVATASITVSPTVTTTYTVTVTNAAGCTSQASRTVTVNALPTAAVSGTNNICSGSSTTLTASGGGTYLWNTGAATAAINVSPTVTTTYTVTATNAVGCTAQASRTVTVNTLPVVTASSNSPVTFGNNLQLTANGAVSYSWSGPNGFTSSVQNPVITSATTAASGAYTVTGFNASGCSNTATVNATVLANPATALQTDGVNDYVAINNPFRAFGKELTVEFWMNTPNAIMPYGSVMGQATSGVDNMSTNVWLMHPNTTGGIDFLVNDAGTWRGVTVPIQAGGWHHYVGVSSEFGTKFYVDGVLEATGPAVTTGIVNNANSVIHIGKDVRHNTGRFGDITVDEVRIWNRVLCEGEINNSRNCELNPSSLTGLQQYYRFNQGFVGANNSQEATLIDASGNGRDGQLIDFALTGANSNWVASGSTNTGTCNSFSPPTAPITGSTYICIGATGTLSNAISGGLWSSSNTSVATINANTGLVTTVGGGITTITYKNECGGISTATVVVTALAKPTITAGLTTVCPGNTVILSAPGGFGNFYQWYKDGVAISGGTSSSYTATVSGSYTAARTGNGCSSTPSNAIVVTIADATKPVITCPSNQTLNLDASCNATLPDYRNLLTATDNCTAANNLVITQSPAAGTIVNGKGALIVTFTVTDASNNSSSCTISVDKKDVTDPVITCPAPITVNNTANTCGAVVNYINPTATDNCTGGAFNFFSVNEPNNYQGLSEDYIQLYTNGTWNDLPNSSLNNSIIEFNDIRSNVYSGYTLIGTFGGHTYYKSTGTASWTSSRSAAQAIGGDLASINTLGESSFLAPYGGSTWVGGYQDKTVPGFQEPGNANQNFRGWKWVDGTELGAGQIVITQTAGLPSGSVFPVGVTTNTFTATDESGNENTCSFTVTVRDVQPPVIVCPANINVTATSASGAVVNYTAPVGTDNCSGATTVRTAGLASGSSFAIGTTIITYRVTDAAGLSTQCSFAVTVVGVPPSINCPSNITVNATTGTCGANVNFAATEATAIPASSITYMVNGSRVASGANFPVGTTTVVATASNAIGISTCSFTITVVDNEKPTITAPAAVQANNTSGLCTGTVTLGDAVTADNCGVSTVTNDAPATFPVGSTTVTWTVTDIHGNKATATQTVVIVDTEKPTIIAPGTVQANNTPGLCTGTVLLGTAITADNCGVSTVTNDAPATFPVGSTTVNWTVTDIHGNIATATQTVVIVDTEKPTIIAPGTVQANNTPGLCTGTVLLGTAITADNCGVSTVTNDAPATFPVGSTTVTWTVTDIHGNIATATQTIVIVDTEKPTIIAPGTVQANNTPGLCTGTIILGTPVTADNCGVSTVTNDAPATFPVGSTTVTWTVTDIHGNAATATQTVVIVDNENPTITAPAAVQANNTPGLCTGTVSLGEPVTADNCGVSTVTNDAPATFPVGSTTVTWTVTDVHGNAATATQTVVIVDNEKPTITAPAAVQANNTPGLCTGTVILGTAVTGDNCGVSTVTNDAPATFPVGSTTVTWTVTDVHGNTATATQTVVIVDTEKPTISTTNINVNNDAGKCGASVTIAQPETGDNCGVATVVGVRSDNALLTADYPVGTTTITWTVTDVHGNTASTTQTVVVNDTELPVVLSQNITIQLGANGTASVTPAQINNGSTDNCGIASVTLSKLSFDCSNVGANTVVLMVTDIHGNSATANATVTVQDNIAPTVITKPVTVTLVNGSATITAAQVNNGSFDNCTIATMTVSPASFTCNNIGTNTVILTVTDVNGNTASKTAIVTVVGQLPSCSIVSVPTSNVYTGGNPNNIYLGYGAQSTVLSVTATGGSSYTYQWSGAGTNMLNSTTIAAPVFTPTAPGNYTFIVTVTNNFGCTTTCSISICVRDIRVPGTKGGAKVYICHVPPGNKNNPQTLEISVNAVPSHLGQHSDDKLGACNMTSCAEPAPIVVTNTQVSKGKVTEESKADTEEELKVTVMPNPSSTYFTLKLESKYDMPVNMRVVDGLGRVVDSRTKLGANATIEVGRSYQTGYYFAEFTQANRRKVVQLIKIK